MSFNTTANNTLDLDLSFNMTNNLTSDNLTALLDYYNYSVDYTWLLKFNFYLYKVTVPILFVVIILVGLIGNVLVVSVILFKRKMRTTLNLLLLNLAVSDILFVSIGIPFVCYHYAADNWILGEGICKLTQYIIYVCVYVTTTTLVSIAAVRFMTIVHPATSSRIRTKRNILLIVATIWIVTLCCNIPVLIIYKVKTFPINTIEPYYYCGMIHKEMGKRVFLAFFVLTYIFPLVSITSFYFLITKYLYKAKAQAIRLKRGSTTSDALKTKRARMSYATRLLFIVCAVFAVCWLPLHIHLLVVYFGVQPRSEVYEVFRFFCHCLAYSNSCMNPIIYNYASREFRKNFKELLSKCLCCTCRCSLFLKTPLVSACELRMVRNGTENGTARSSPTLRNASTYIKPSFY